MQYQQLQHFQCLLMRQQVILRALQSLLPAPPTHTPQQHQRDHLFTCYRMLGVNKTMYVVSTHIQQCLRCSVTHSKYHHGWPCKELMWQLAEERGCADTTILEQFGVELGRTR